MTTTHAAPALQEATPTDDQILEVFAEFRRPNEEQCGMTINAVQIVAAVRALLSNLRAPLAEEARRTVLEEVNLDPAFPNYVLSSVQFHELWERAGQSCNPNSSKLQNVRWQVGKFSALVAKEARATVPGEARLDGVVDSVLNAVLDVQATLKARQVRMAGQLNPAQLADICDELNRLGMIAHTAMYQNARDMSNIMEDLADRLLALAGSASAPSPGVAAGAVAWFDPKGDHIYNDGITPRGNKPLRNTSESDHAVPQTVALVQASAQARDSVGQGPLVDVEPVMEAIRSAGLRDHPTNIERKRVDAILAAVAPVLRNLRAPIENKRVTVSAVSALAAKWEAWVARDLEEGGPENSPAMPVENAARQLRAALASAPAKPTRAPADDWRVLAIAECLEKEWDDMTADLAKDNARLLVGYMISYAAEAAHIGTAQAGKPVHPVVQAMGGLPGASSEQHESANAHQQAYLKPVATVMCCGQRDETGRYFLDAICPEGDCNIRAGDLLYSGPPHAVSEAVRDVLLERARQINGEGFGVARDDAYVSGELAQAAACYAASSHSRDISYMSHLWPWASEWWKPGTTREDLLKSGALILAEIERIDRARAAQSTQQRKEG